MNGYRWLWPGLLGCSIGLAQGEAPRAFVEVEAAVGEPWLQQPFVVVVRVGLDAAFFADSAVPLLAQPLDLPFVLSMPWRAGEQLDCRTIAADAGRSVAVDDQVLSMAAAGERTVAGRRFDLFELRERCLPKRAGPLSLEPTVLRYAYAEQFETDFLRGRHAVDHHEARVESAPLRITVRELPAGAPAGFGGAVGEFELQASGPAASVHAGESFRFELTVSGDGNLQQFPSPPWPELPGFVVRGVIERSTPAARGFAFDVLAVHDGATAVPPVSLVAFSPRQQRYVTVRSAPVPLRVLPAIDERSLPADVQQLLAAERARLAGRPWWHYAIAGLLLGLVLWSWRRARSRARRWRSLMAACGEVRVAVAQAPATAAAALEALCCLGLRLERFDLDAVSASMHRLGAGAAGAANLQSLLARLQAARFGGPMPSSAEVDATMQAFTAFCQRRLP